MYTADLIFVVYLVRVFFAIMFGAQAIGRASEFAPDYGKATSAAARIFAMLDRVPSLDSYSTEGSKPVLILHDSIIGRPGPRIPFRARTKSNIQLQISACDLQNIFNVFSWLDDNFSEKCVVR